MARNGRRWFWEEIPSEDGACYAVMYLEDGEDRGVTFCQAYVRGDAEEIIEAMKWQDAFRSGRGLFLPEEPAPRAVPKKKPPVRKTQGARK